MEVKMKKEIFIEGMTCNHCKMRVENALSGLEGVTSATVDLAAKKAVVEMSAEIDESVLTQTVDDAGYDVMEIK